MKFQSALILLLVSPAAAAQDIYIDVGMNLDALGIGAPTPAYGAAAGAAGVWNPVMPAFAPTPLVDTLGGTTGVTVSTDNGSSFNQFPAVLSGDDKALVNDLQALDSLQTPSVWTFSGLADGTYDVYTYAWDPSNGGATTEVSVPALPGSTQLVGGTWAGSPHVLGTTYALHQVAVAGGSLVLEARSAVFGTGGQVNGFQLVQTSSSSPFAPYCFGDGSGTTCPCGNSAASGEGCANSGGGGASLSATGTTSVAQDDQVFSAAGLVPSQPALLFVGDNAVNGGNGTLFGDGLRCAGGNVVRLGVRQPDAGGHASWGPGMGASGGWSAGETKRFQVWYRDPSGSPCGGVFNLSSGLEVAFTN